MASGSEQPIYSIGAVAKMLDIPGATLRAWEERYGAIVPHRSEGSQRLYSRAQVEQLRFVQAALERGLSAADAHRLLGQEIKAGSADTDRRPLVLLAERDPYAAELAEYLLRTEGCEVRTAMDSRQAVDLFHEQEPALVVIDLLISGGAGFRLCREFSAAADVPILALSALESSSEALSSGASAFLHKPVESIHLVSVVRDLLGTSVLTRSVSHSQQVV